VIFYSYFPFYSNSNDSKYYAEQVVRAKNAPLKETFFPKWGTNYWSFSEKDYIKDHFPGHLILGRFFSELIPSQGAQAAQMLLQMLFFLLSLVVSCHLFKMNITISFVFIPITFIYTARANHEYGLLFFTILSLWAVFSFLKSTQHKGLFLCLACVSTMLAFMIKGASALLLPFGHFLFLCFFKEYKKAFLVSFFTTISLFSMGAIFEQLFHHYTGESFLNFYISSQILQRSLEANGDISFFSRKLQNLTYYFTRLFLYSLPWSLFLLLNFWKKEERLKIKEKLTIEQFRLSNFFISYAFSWALIFSYSDRFASRYIFPCFYFLALGSFVQLWPFLQRFLSPILFTNHLLTALTWTLMALSHGFFFLLK